MGYGQGGQYEKKAEIKRGEPAQYLNCGAIVADIC